MRFITGLLSGSFVLAFSAFLILALPFNVIAMMRLFGWEWWTALIVAVIMQVIPLLGQLAYLVLAIMGAYYLIDAGFDWRRATAAVSAPAPDFATYKSTVLKPRFEQQCIDEGKRRAGLSSVPAVIKFCECYVGAAVSTAAEMQSTAPPSEDLRRKIAAVAQGGAAVR